MRNGINVIKIIEKIDKGTTEKNVSVSFFIIFTFRDFVTKINQFKRIQL